MVNPYSESELRKALNSGENVLFLMPIQREEIENMDLRRVEDFFKVLAKIGEPVKQRCGLSVSGYDDTPDELFEIKEVHKFVQKLFRRIPHLMYYINTEVGYDEWLMSSWADVVDTVRTGDQIGLNVYEVLEKYGTDAPRFKAVLTFDEDKFDTMLQGLRKHGKKIGDPVGANQIADVLDKHFSIRIKG